MSQRTGLALQINYKRIHFCRATHAPVLGPEVSGLNTLIILGHTGVLLLIHINHIRKIFVTAPKAVRDSFC